MSDTALLIADMVREGVSPEIIGRVAAALAEREVVVMKDQSAERRREKDREYRRERRSVGRNLPTSDDTPTLSSFEVSPQTPLPKTSKPIPPSPPKGGSSPTAKTKPTKAQVDAIWNSAPIVARQRSSVADVELALTAAMRRGHDPDAVLAGLQAAYRTESYSGDRAKGVHRLIERDRWASFAETAAPAAPEASFDGPLEVRASIVAATDEDFARRWIDPYCRWDAGGRRLIASAPAVEAQLTRHLAAWAEKNRVTFGDAEKPKLAA